MTEGQKICKQLAAYFCDPSGTDAIDTIFNEMQSQPGLVALQALKQLTVAMKEKGDADSLGLQSFIVGMTVGLGAHDQNFIACIKDFFEAAKKAQGANVVDFRIAKAAANV